MPATRCGLLTRPHHTFYTGTHGLCNVAISSTYFDMINVSLKGKITAVHPVLYRLYTKHIIPSVFELSAMEKPNQKAKNNDLEILSNYCFFCIEPQKFIIG